MPDPGLLLNGLTVPGLVRDYQPEEWQRQVQYTSQFGLSGTTALDGDRAYQDFTVPMLIFSPAFGSRADLISFLQACEKKVGTEIKDWQYYDLSGVLVERRKNVEFRNIKRNLDRFDPNIGYWADCHLSFRALTTEPPK